MQDIEEKKIVYTGPPPMEFNKGDVLEVTFGSDAGKVGRVIEVRFNRHNGLWVYTIRFRDLRTETFVASSLKESTTWMI